MGKDKKPYVCPKCFGKGKYLSLKRAKEKRNPKVWQAFVQAKCPDCNGTGRVDKQI